MARRPLFLPGNAATLWTERLVEFQWFPGFATSQKQKSIASLHEAAREADPSLRNVLEVSSKSEQSLGRELSAFHLQVPFAGGRIPMESAFQGSKLFPGGIQFTELYHTEPSVAKRHEPLRTSGPIVGFRFEEETWSNEPPSAFYDWLYVSALRELSEETQEAIASFDAFTDIEFNPRRSLNCQARSAAIFATVLRNHDLSVVDKPDAFVALYDSRFFA